MSVLTGSWKQRGSLLTNDNTGTNGKIIDNKSGYMSYILTCHTYLHVIHTYMLYILTCHTYLHVIHTYMSYILTCMNNVIHKYGYLCIMMFHMNFLRLLLESFFYSIAENQPWLEFSKILKSTFDFSRVHSQSYYMYPY